MDTPPNTGASRPNFMHFRRGEGEDDYPRNNQMMMKFGPKYQLYKKQIPLNTERENVVKIMNQMKKQISFLDNTKWMFENNSLLHSDNYSNNPL